MTGDYTDLKSKLRGELIQPGDAKYDEARKLYNAMIDKRPALIARCVDVADVTGCVNYARENGILLAIRGGGHNGPGLGSCNDGLVIDLSRMRGVKVNPAAKTAQVAGGCVWGDVDHATHAFGMAAPSGVISTTGVGGLTLGGGNFGVVTSFTFRLHPIREVTAGPIFWPLEDAPEVMKQYERFITDAPDEINGFFAFLVVPPAPMFPKELHMRTVCGVVWCSTVDQRRTSEILKPTEQWAKPLLNGVSPMPFPTLQTLFDGLYPPGLQWYWKADFVNHLSDEAIAQYVKYGSELPNMFSSMHLYPINGAVHRVKERDTAFSYRDTKWSQVIVGVDPDPANNDKIIDWARKYWDAVHPYSAGGAYVNFMMEEGTARVEATYGGNYPRLRQIKARYDSSNLFRVNQNIAP